MGNLPHFYRIFKQIPLLGRVVRVDNAFIHVSVLYGQEALGCGEPVGKSGIVVGILKFAACTQPYHTLGIFVERLADAPAVLHTHCTRSNSHNRRRNNCDTNNNADNLYAFFHGFPPKGMYSASVGNKYCIISN